MNLLFERESFEIRGACFWVWKEFGSAFKESIIDKALTQELKKRGLKVENQKRINIFYNQEKVGVYVPDKIINDAIIIEVKSKPQLTNQDIKQFWHYLKGTDYKLGFLINFGEKLEIKRVIYEKARIREKIRVANPREDPRSGSAFLSAEKGFTLMEVIVATTIFAMVMVAMMALFNYTLKINRKAEALRQTTQGVRNFTEFIVKAVRNGQIDYSVDKGTALLAPVSPCHGTTVLGSDAYGDWNTALGIITPESERWCLYLGDISGNVVSSGYTGETLVLQKENSINKEILNPPNFRIENLAFFVRPKEDPYFTGAGGLIRSQPFVTIVMKIKVTLPTGEVEDIYYQTTVSSDKYDIPNN